MVYCLKTDQEREPWTITFSDLLLPVSFGSPWSNHAPYHNTSAFRRTQLLSQFGHLTIHPGGIRQPRMLQSLPVLLLRHPDVHALPLHLNSTNILFIQFPSLYVLFPFLALHLKPAPHKHCLLGCQYTNPFGLWRAAPQETSATAGLRTSAWSIHVDHMKPRHFDTDTLGRIFVRKAHVGNSPVESGQVPFVWGNFGSNQHLRATGAAVSRTRFSCAGFCDEYARRL